MKNIKFIQLFLIAFSLIVSSCAIDDDDAIIPTGTTVTASLDKTGEIYAFAGNEINLGFVLSRSIGNPTLFSYTLNGVENSVDLAIGDQSVSISIPNVVGETNTIVLTEASALTNDIVSVGSTNTTVTFIGVPAPSPGNLELVFLNEDEQGLIWFGMSLFTSTGGWITDYNQNSNGGYPRFMSIPLNGNGNLGTIPNSADVTPDIIGLDLFTQTTISSDMQYSILVVSPDGSVQELTGTLPATGSFVDTAVVRIDVTDDAANPGLKNYVFSNF